MNARPSHDRCVRSYLELRCLISRKICFDRLHVHVWGPVRRHRTKVSTKAMGCGAVRTIRSGGQAFRLLYQIPDSRSKRSTSPSSHLLPRLRIHTLVCTTNCQYTAFLVLSHTPWRFRHREVSGIPPHFLFVSPRTVTLKSHRTAGSSSAFSAAASCAHGFSRRDSIPRVIKPSCLISAINQRLGGRALSGIGNRRRWLRRWGQSTSRHMMTRRSSSAGWKCRRARCGGAIYKAFT